MSSSGAIIGELALLDVYYRVAARSRWWWGAGEEWVRVCVNLRLDLPYALFPDVSFSLICTVFDTYDIRYFQFKIFFTLPYRYALPNDNIQVAIPNLTLTLITNVDIAPIEILGGSMDGSSFSGLLNNTRS